MSKSKKNVAAPKAPKAESTAKVERNIVALTTASGHLAQAIAVVPETDPAYKSLVNVFNRINKARTSDADKAKKRNEKKAARVKTQLEGLIEKAKAAGVDLATLLAAK